MNSTVQHHNADLLREYLNSSEQKLRLTEYFQPHKTLTDPRNLNRRSRLISRKRHAAPRDTVSPGYPNQERREFLAGGMIDCLSTSRFPRPIRRQLRSCHHFPRAVSFILAPVEKTAVGTARKGKIWTQVSDILSLQTQRATTSLTLTTPAPPTWLNRHSRPPEGSLCGAIPFARATLARLRTRVGSSKKELLGLVRHRTLSAFDQSRQVIYRKHGNPRSSRPAILKHRLPVTNLGECSDSCRHLTSRKPSTVLCPLRGTCRPLWRQKKEARNFNCRIGWPKQLKSFEVPDATSASVCHY